MPTPHEFRTVADFVDLSEDELRLCLQAFGRAVLAVKIHRQALIDRGRDPASIPFDKFVWNSREAGREAATAPYPEMPLSELPLRTEAKIRLREMHVFALEDLSQVTELELIVLPNVGPLAVRKIRGLLAQIGLSLKPSDDPKRRLADAARLARKVSPGERYRNLTNASPVALLGFTASTYARTCRAGIRSVGELRGMNLRELCCKFGKNQVVEILDVLTNAGLALSPPPSDFELWREGLKPASALRMPSDPATVIECAAPWLGRAVARRCREHGIETLGALADGLRNNHAAGLFGHKTLYSIRSFLREAGLLEPPLAR